MTKPSDETQFSVVVLGSMNPALHHPSWYKYIGILDDEAESSALSNEFVFLPQLGQFRTKEFQLFCDTQRWQVVVPSSDQFDRAIEIAKVTFDDRLVETPIRAYGLNFNHHLATKCSDVGAAIAQLLCGLPFGFRQQDGTTGKLSFTQPVADGIVRCDVEPSARHKTMVYVAFNAHYELASKAEPTPISLNALIRSHLDEVLENVRTRVDRVMAVFQDGGN